MLLSRETTLTVGRLTAEKIHFKLTFQVGFLASPGASFPSQDLLQAWTPSATSSGAEFSTPVTEGGNLRFTSCSARSEAVHENSPMSQIKTFELFEERRHLRLRLRSFEFMLM